MATSEPSLLNPTNKRFSILSLVKRPSTWTVTASCSTSRTDAFKILESGNLDRVRRAFDPIPPYVENENGETPLIVCARRGDVVLSRYFLDNGADPNAKDEELWTALLNAAKEGFYEICELLIESGANLEDEDVGRWTPLCWAVYKNRIQLVRLLISKGAKVNLIDEHNMTPLIWAASRGYAEVSKLLIDAGARVDVRDRFGNNPLLWACRRDNLDIVKALLNAGSPVDVVGMKGCTALILATKCNNVEMVAKIVAKSSCAINAVDHNGYTALIHAVQNGNAEIVNLLLENGVSVTMSDQLAENVLLRAVKTGHAEIVRLLLQKHADVDYQDHEGRTALHLACDRNNVQIASVLCESLPNLELKNDEGDTPLLKATRSRSLAMVQLLKMAGANVGAVDKHGDTSVHIALRARSRRLVQILLAPPFDSRILYQPNKAKETPYSIDRTGGKPILRHLFGPLDSSLKTEAMMGYELYSSVLADILCAPNLSLPIFVGLYAKWGSGKSFLLRKVKEALLQIGRDWFTPYHLSWSWTVAFSMSICCLLPGSVLFSVLPWHTVLASVVTIFLSLSLAYLYLVKSNHSTVRNWNLYVCNQLAFMRLTYLLLFFNPPTVNERDLFSFPISFVFAEYRRLSNFECEHALNNIVDSLYRELEKHYGRIPVRLARSLNTPFGKHRLLRLRRICGIPLLVLVIVMVLMLTCGIYLCLLYRKAPTMSGAFLFGLALVFCVIVIAFYPVILLCAQTAFRRPRKATKRLLTELDNLRFEAFMENLSNELETLDRTIARMDNFTKSQTRLVVLMDGLDSCEGSRIVQTLDAIHVLFGRSSSSRFIVLISIDPHVVLSAVKNNLQSAFLQSEVSSYDYLKTIVHMAIYLRNSEFLKLHQQLANRQRKYKTFDSNRMNTLLRQDAMTGSYWSIAESCRDSIRSPKPSHPHGFGQTTAFGPEIVRDDYFGDINPRSMRRVIHALSITGRLMRAFEIEFSWVTLGHWISLIEQWPYRMCWIIEYSEKRALADELTLQDVYKTIKQRIPEESDTLMGMDRNPKGLDTYFNSEMEPVLCVSHMNTFLPFTCSLDPYVRRLIRDQLDQMDKSEGLTALTAEEKIQHILGVPLGVARLFQDPFWMNMRLSLLTTSEVVRIIEKLPISSDEARTRYANACRSSNLSGLVLSVCDLHKLKQELQMNFGDWELFSLMVEHLRTCEKSLQNGQSLTAPLHAKESNAGNRTPGSRRFNVRARRRNNFEKLNNDDEYREEGAQHNWLRNRLGYLDSVDQNEEEEESVSNKLDSRRSSITFDGACMAKDSNSVYAEPDFVQSERSTSYPNALKQTSSKQLGSREILMLNSDDSDENDSQATVQPKKPIQRPTILPLTSVMTITKTTSEPDLGGD